MELKQSDYERLGKIYGLERQIEERNAKFAEVKAAHRKGNKELTDQIMELKKEIACPVETPELPLTATYPEKEEKISVPRQENPEIVKPRKARGKAKGDTMKVERTLTRVATFGTSCETLENEKINEFGGCCICEKEKCDLRLIKFGEASKCHMGEACSQECPRFITEPTSPAEGAGKTTDKNVCATQENNKDYVNASKLASYGYTAIRLDVEKKSIEIFNKCIAGGFAVPAEPFKTKKATILEFEKMLLDDAGVGYLDINRPNHWLTRSKLGHLKLFRGDYQGASYPMKRIRFQDKDHSWGRAEKFTNEIQYFARLEELRKDPNYIEA